MNKKILVLAIFLAFGFLVRLYKINTPLADWHSWRQADTASVSYRFLTEGIDLFHPKYHDLSNIPNGLDNPEGYRMVEFPLYNVLHVFMFRLFSVINLSFTAAGRLTSVLISLVGALFLFLLLLKKTSRIKAFLVLFVYLFLPFNIFYQRTILPENLLVASCLAFLYFFDSFLETKDKKSLYFLASILFAVIALLTKPTAVFFMLPALVLAHNKLGFSFFKKPVYWIAALIPAFCFLSWRIWIARFPEGIPAYTWLLNGNNIRFKPAFFRWIFGDRIARLILGYWGLVFLPWFFTKLGKNALFWLAWQAGALLYLIVFATGNVQHDYYQIVIMPALSVMLGLGIVNFAKSAGKLAFLQIFVYLAFTLGFSWFFIRDYYNINHPEIVSAGQKVQEITPDSAKIIAPYMGDTAFLWQTRRTGWPIGGNIPDKIEKGADYYVSVNYDDETNMLIESCSAIEKTDEYVIVSLEECQL